MLMWSHNNLRVIPIVLLWLIIFAPVDASAELCRIDVSGTNSLSRVLEDQVSLLNEVIRNPKIATVRSWHKLGNSHDETEIAFYANSISDGTEAVYSKAGLQEKIIRHSRQTSDKSTVLEFLRLAVLSMLNRPPSQPPQFKVHDLKQIDQGSAVQRQEVKLRADFTWPESNTSMPSTITFDVYETELSAKNPKEICANIRTIEVGSVTIFGWWYETKNSFRKTP